MAGVQKINPTSESPITTTDSRPVPDPTNLTTQQLNAAIAALKELFEARFQAMNKAVDVLSESAGKSPTIGEVYAKHKERFSALEHTLQEINLRIDARHGDIVTEITHLRELHNEKFNGFITAINGLENVSDQRFARVDSQFIERDRAVVAALQATKDAFAAQNTSNTTAISKSEGATVESIRQLQTLLSSSIAALNDKLNDTRSRLDRGDGSSSGGREARSQYHEERTDVRGMLFGIIGALLGAGALVATIITLSIRTH